MVRFAGVAGADVGGPLREFLVLCMRKLHLLGQLVFGEPTSLAFQLSSGGILQKQFYKFGQLSAYFILLLGRGPECFQHSEFFQRTSSSYSTFQTRTTFVLRRNRRWFYQEQFK